jgi:hypothetical protein
MPPHPNHPSTRTAARQASLLTPPACFKALAFFFTLQAKRRHRRGTARFIQRHIDKKGAVGVDVFTRKQVFCFDA